MLAPARILSRTLFYAAVAALMAGCGAGTDKVAVNAADTAVPDGLAAIPAGELHYYPPGEYTKGGYPVSPPLAQVNFDSTLYIMQRQVSQAEFAACVQAKACKRLDKDQRDAVDPNLPVVGVSWRDATDYAAWLSGETGHHYRLPTFAEWVHAAGPGYKEDILLDTFDPADPAQRWLAEYKLETQRQTAVDAQLRPFGGFGQNEAGMQDMVGNVWDWTDTCHSRYNLDISDTAGAAGGTPNCGVRVVAGPHRSVITDFIRDPKGGACSVGIPPSNLGFRLVRDDSADAAKPSLMEKLGMG
ncbi:formylglycine-generating enzyme family protein [Pusillimonas sp. MFBS29]|uniref:formylglycine-generating enzyme family protein n=1 Tax=Pusillimonas sp. MFBS29 TaxID=2886690 RepID=UPI001D0F8E80|nr:SUMF1/EgtB/PvdO family nonheme iron enzyme [Pusillimonas sp. MFBS29]MCC2596101.1 formylglycine-generating enzyme family protein [Pusillimonas sp. MFBS29]